MTNVEFYGVVLATGLRVCTFFCLFTPLTVYVNMTVPQECLGRATSLTMMFASAGKTIGPISSMVFFAWTIDPHSSASGLFRGFSVSFWVCFVFACAGSLCAKVVWKWCDEEFAERRDREQGEAAVAGTDKD